MNEAPNTGYYDYHALVQLERPVALIGLDSAVTRTIGFQLSALFGLPFRDLDRLVEHSSGCSVSKMILFDGEEAYRELEWEQLQKVSRDRPYGVWALGDGALIRPSNQQFLSSAATLVVLQQSVDGCFRTHQERSWREDESGWHPLHRELLVSPDQLGDYVDRRRPGHSLAHLQISIDGLAATRVVKNLAEVLPGFRPS